jgi:cell division protein FtsA
MPRAILGLDIGTAHVKAILAEPVRSGEFKIVEAIKSASSGVIKGTVVDAEEVAEALKPVFESLKSRNKGALRDIYVNIGGERTNVHSSRGVIAVSRADNEIYQDDVDRVIRASQASVALPNRAVVHTETKEFVVDATSDIPDPLGLIGHRLEVHSLVVDVFAPHAKNISQAIESAGGTLSAMLFGTLAASKAVLTKKQKELGVVFMDIGAGTTSMSVYEEGKLLHAKIFRIGAGNVTNDLAMGFKIPVASAENLKLNFGYAIARQIGNKESIDLSVIDSSVTNAVPKKFAAEIIEARLAEIFELVNNELKLIGKSGQLPGGVVLAGGGAKLPGIVELARQELKLPAQIAAVASSAFRIEDDYLRETIEDPEFVGALGLILWGKELGGKTGNTLMGQIKRNPIRNVLKYFLP